MILILFLPLLNLFATELDLGVRSTFKSKSHETIYNRNYVNLRSLDSTEKLKNFESEIDLRFFIDHNLSDNQFDAKTVALHYLGDNFEVKGGLLIYKFSETFGPGIADIVGPKDFSDLFLNDEEWRDLPVPSVNVLMMDGPLTMQPIFNLVTKKSRLPARGSEYDPYKESQIESAPEREFELIDDSEFGVRIGRLFENGIDLKGMVFNHYNRAPVIVLDQSLKLEREYKRVTTMMINGSYSYEESVFRGDVVYTPNDLVSPYSLVKQERDHLQSILGSDYTYNDFTFGIQHHYDSVKGDQWGSLMLALDHFERKLRTELLLFHGLNNDDYWLRPKIIVSVSNTEGILWCDRLGGDLRHGGLGYYKKSDRMGFDIKASF